MQYMVDTNIFLWYIEDDQRLENDFRDLLDDPGRDFWLSVASLWEITIKVSRGNLLTNINLKDYFQRQVFDNGFRVFPVKTEHLLTLKDLPFHHKDPFDRMIIAQSRNESLTLLYSDEIFEHYFST